MRVLLVGASGTIGRPLCDALQQRGDEVIAAGRRGRDVVDIRSAGSIEAMYQAAGRVDACVCVAESSALDSFEDLTKASLLENMRGRKMAQVGIMNALSMEGEAHGILVNAVSPAAKTRMWGVTQPPEDLKPKWVAPGVLYLASPLCQDTGIILRASNGQFTATRYNENPRCAYPKDLARITCSSMEEIASKWNRIKEFDVA